MKSAIRKRAVEEKIPAKIISLAPKGKKAPFPKDIMPMLATLVKEPPDGDNWLYEVKWDGYRAMALMNKGKVELRSRNGKSFNEKYYPVYNAAKDLGINAVVDGEIMVVTDKGISRFNALQAWRSEADGELIYYVFDIVWLDGYSLMELPLIERRELLRDLIPKEGIIRLSENYEATGSKFFAIARKLGMEGIIGKRKESFYYPSARSEDWVKIKTGKRQEVVIGGYTINEGTKKPFSSLLVGVFNNGTFEYIGKVGTGFNVKQQKELLKQFKEHEVSKSPFSVTPDINKPSRFRPEPPQAKATWLKPQLICEVSYAELTPDKVMRQPSFEGMRVDKKAKDVVLEVEKEVDVREHKKLAEKKVLVTGGKRERKTLLNPSEESQTRVVNGHEIKFNNLSKLYWPDDKVTKRDMINFYYQIAPFIVPYLKDRPLTLNRYPGGINGISFYQKDITGKAPDWVESFLYHSNADKRDKHFMVGTDEASLLYAASLGCIEMHPWNSRRQMPDNPDWCIIDLDPDKNSFNQVIEAAQVTKKLLDAIGVAAYCKTSGSTGLHIYIPLGAKYTYEQSKEFGRALATVIHNEIPDYTSIERKVADREGKMYIDFLQNRPQATVAAPYSLRPKPDATVSMPLHWEEVKKGLKMKDYTIFNAVARARSEGDIFKPVLGKGIDMKKALKKMDEL